MKFSDELWKPVAFISKSLSDTERNYEIHDKEMLAVVRCLEAWRHFLEGTTTKFEIWTDHKNLYDVTNFIQPYLYQVFNNSHSLNGTQKPLKRPFD